MSDTRSLHRKLAQVMLEAERIPKRGRAPQVMGGYPFVQVGDAADYIRKALAEQLLTMVPTSVRVVGMQDRVTKQGGNMTTVDLIVTWTITDGESGESITIESFGAGADGGDKYSGKASTSAMKYALLTGFLLSTGEDSELGTSEAEGHALASPVLAKGETRATDEGGLQGVVDRQGRMAPGPRSPPDAGGPRARVPAQAGHDRTRRCRRSGRSRSRWRTSPASRASA